MITKTQAPRDRQLDEYIDGLHFLLSLGNDLAYDFSRFRFAGTSKPSIVEQYFVIIEAFNHLATNYQIPHRDNAKLSEYFEAVLANYLAVAQLANYQAEELLLAYRKKNEINFIRQNQRY